MQRAGQIQEENDVALSQYDQSENTNITFLFGTHQSRSMEKSSFVYT